MFSAIDTDGNNNLTCEEVKSFIEILVNGGPEYGHQHLVSDKKGLLDKDLRIFINFMDIDRNNMINKAEFLKQYTKLEGIVKKQYHLYKQALLKERDQGLQEVTALVSSERETKDILKKMQLEGLNLKQFINHLPTIAETEGSGKSAQRLVKLGPLLK